MAAGPMRATDIIGIILFCQFSAQGRSFWGAAGAVLRCRTRRPLADWELLYPKCHRRPYSQRLVASGGYWTRRRLAKMNFCEFRERAQKCHNKSRPAPKASYELYSRNQSFPPSFMKIALGDDSDDGRHANGQGRCHRCLRSGKD